MRFRTRYRPFSLQALLILLLAVQIVGLLLWHIFWPQPAITQLAKAPVELSVLISEAGPSIWRELADEFEAQHPNITIKLWDKPDDTTIREGLYKEDFNFEQPRYDLVFMDVIWLAAFKDYLMDLNPFIERDGVELSAFLDSEIAVGRYDAGLLKRNSLYRLPMYPDVGVLYYRRDLLAAAGLPLPETLEDLKSTIQTVKSSSNIASGYLWQGESYEGLVVNFFELMHSFDGQWINNGRARLNNKKTIETVRVLKQLIESEISPDTVTDYTETLSREAFVAGKSIFLRGWPDFWREIQGEDSVVKGKVAIAHPFSFSPGNPGISCRGGWGFGISKKSVHNAEAWEAIKYFTSESVQKRFVLASGALPSRKALFDDADINKAYPFMHELRTYLDDYSEFRPNIKPYIAVSKVLQSALSDALRKEGVVEEAMAAAQEKTQQLLRTAS